MPLESCMIVLDNSEFMRNGDYVPTRMEAQHDAANMIVGQKTQSNAESTVGVLAMSGGSGSTGSSVGAELLLSPTDDMGKILSALHGVPIRGKGWEGGASASSGSSVDVAASVQVASLALKHRINKNGAQRIVLFVGSPLGHVESRALSKAGRQLKKNNVAIDVVAMGELEENETKLRELVDAANGSSGSDGERTCHLVTIPAGVLPSDVLISSPIINGGSGGDASAAMGAGASDVGGAGASGAFAEFAGVDPNTDPELAMALRVSMEEERARQERAAAAAAEESKQAEEQKNEGGENMEVEGGATADTVENARATADGGVEVEMADGDAGGADDEDDEDALLQQALAMSMNDNRPAAEEAKATTSESAAEATSKMEEDEDDDEAAMQLALQMSMKKDGEEKGGEGGQQFQDPQFVNELLGTVNSSDPALQNALRNANQGEKKDEEAKKEGDKKDDGEGK